MDPDPEKINIDPQKWPTEKQSYSSELTSIHAANYLRFWSRKSQDKNGRDGFVYLGLLRVQGLNSRFPNVSGLSWHRHLVYSALFFTKSTTVNLRMSVVEIVVRCLWLNGNQ
jgi:hypothetical protein